MALHVMHVSSEVYPFSKTGGLADVLGALPLEQAKLGQNGESVQVTVVSPWYGRLGGGLEPERVAQFQVPGMAQPSQVGRIVEGGVTYLFIRQWGFEGPELYGLKNDLERFVYFCKAVPFAAAALELRPDIVHAHDWGSGLLPALLRFTAVPPQMQGVKTVFTIHNLQYQGRWNPWDVLHWSGLPADLVHPDGLEFFGDVNLLKAGVVYSDAVTTVSPGYAQEITTLEYGEKLEGVLRRTQQEGRLHGILNGLDMERWNPKTDPYAPFDGQEGKARVKGELLKSLKLENRPTLGLVSRFAQQKGVDLVIEALGELLEDWNVIILGSGDIFPERVLTLLGKYAPGLHFRQGFEEALAHRIYAGVDAFLMPSRFEPCGLAQMISMRYGTLPIARDTGGLHDTVTPDIGFLFPEASFESLLEGTNKALEVFQGRPQEWRSRMEAAMKLDWSWEKGAGEYLELYRRLLRG
jgi:starch synthase